MVKLGQIAQCSQSFLSKVESGIVVPSIPMLIRIAVALEINPSSLCSECDHSLGVRADDDQ
jgi:transcriptional regulator with XRE-family HTH domain